MKVAAIWASTTTATWRSLGHGLQVSEVETPEEFACRLPLSSNGEFIIKRREMYERFQNLVAIRSPSPTGSLSDPTERQGDSTKVLDRVLTKYDFLNAVLK